jgi:hypothetical protein
MIIDDVHIEFLGWGNARLSWTGDPDAVAHVFVNGRLAIEPQRLNTTEKSVVVGVPESFTVEIHELATDLEAVAASIPLERRPVIWWSARDGAEQYRVFHRPDGGTERVIGHVAHSPEVMYYTFRAPIDLRQDGKRWVFLRVEAVGSSGEQSARPLWPLLMAALPAKPSDLNVSGAGGVFNRQLEVSS